MKYLKTIEKIISESFNNQAGPNTQVLNSKIKEKYNNDEIIKNLSVPKLEKIIIKLDKNRHLCPCKVFNYPIDKEIEVPRYVAPRLFYKSLSEKDVIALIVKTAHEQNNL